MLFFVCPCLVLSNTFLAPTIHIEWPKSFFATFFPWIISSLSLAFSFYLLHQWITILPSVSAIFSSIFVFPFILFSFICVLSFLSVCLGIVRSLIIQSLFCSLLSSSFILFSFLMLYVKSKERFFVVTNHDKNYPTLQFALSYLLNHLSPLIGCVFHNCFLLH